MRVPDFQQMITQVEAESIPPPSIEAILRNIETREIITLDIRSGLTVIELQLCDYLRDDNKNPTVDLRIIDTIDKWVYREKKIDIHNAAISLVYEMVRELTICGKWDDYFHGGTYPFVAYYLPISSLFDQIRRMSDSVVYAYLGETT